MIFLELTHSEGIQDDRYNPQKMSVLIFNIVRIAALSVSLSVAGTSGRRADCVSPQGLGPNIICRKCLISKLFNNLDMCVIFALKNCIEVVKHDSWRTQNAGYTESTSQMPYESSDREDGILWGRDTHFPWAGVVRTLSGIEILVTSRISYMQWTFTDEVIHLI